MWLLGLALLSASEGAEIKPVERGGEAAKASHLERVARAQQGGVDLYFLGDSITRRWAGVDYPEFLADWQARWGAWKPGNFGWGGDQVQHILWRIENGELAGLSPKVIVLLAGTNNVGRKPKPGVEDEVVAGLRQIVASCQRQVPGVKIVLMGIFPRADGEPEVGAVISAINRRLAQWHDEENLVFLDLTSTYAQADGKLKEGMMVDKLHLSLAGYRAWGDALEPVIRRLWK